jgi:hypothetical protein
LPHHIGILHAGGDVLRLVGVFVPKLLGPSVLEGFADPLARGVPVQAAVDSGVRNSTVGEWSSSSDHSRSPSILFDVSARNL